MYIEVCMLVLLALGSVFLLANIHFHLEEEWTVKAKRIKVRYMYALPQTQLMWYLQVKLSKEVVAQFHSSYYHKVRRCVLFDSFGTVHRYEWVWFWSHYYTHLNALEFPLSPIPPSPLSLSCQFNSWNQAKPTRAAGLKEFVYFEQAMENLKRTYLAILDLGR